MGKKPAAKSLETAKEKKTPKAETKTTKKVTVAATTKTAAASDGEHCKIKSCKREYRAKGYCEAHYKKWRQGAFGVARYKTCGDVECRKPMVANRHGYCEDHYQNYYVKGVATAKAAPAEKKVEKTEKKEDAA